MKVLRDGSRLIPVLAVAAVIAVGSLAVILLSGGESPGGGGSSAQASSGEQPSAGTGSGGGGSVVKVDIKDFKYDPTPVEVKAGQKLEWVNDDMVEHTATADGGSSFDTGDLKSGQASKPVTLKPGKYTYVCTIHPFMHGTVIVK